MQKTKDPKLAPRFMTVLALLILILMFTGYAQVSDTSIFSFRPNAYALVDVIGVSSSIIMLIIIATRYKSGNDESQWLISYIASLIVFGVGEMFQRLSATPDGAVFWAATSVIGTAFMSISLVLFALSYTRSFNKYATLTTLLIVTSAFMCFFSNSSLFYSLDPASIKSYPWGYNNDPGEGFGTLSLWYAVPIVVAALTLLRYRRRAKSPVLRAQAGIYTIAVAFPFLTSLVTDVGLPAFGIKAMPLGFAFSLGTAATLAYGIAHYKVLRLSPAILAQNVLSTMRESVILTDVHLNIEFMNAEAEKLFVGQQSSKAGGVMTLDKYFDNPQHANAQQAVAKAIGPDGTGEFERVTITSPNGDKFYLRVRMSAVTENNQTTGYIFALTDITELTKTNEELSQSLAAEKELERQLAHEKAGVERKVEERTHELRQERARLEASINSLDAGFFMTDSSAKIITINDAAMHILFGKSSHDSNVTIDELAKRFGDSLALKELIQKCLRTGKTSEFKEVELSGRVLHVFMAPIVSTAAHGELALGTVVLFEDVTEQKVLERSRDEFFSIASHELRTPLTTIRGNTSLILQFYADQVKNKDLHLMLDDILESSKRLIGVVNDFLDVSSLEQNRVDFQAKEFGAEEAIKSVVKEMKTLADDQGVSLVFGKPGAALPKVYADPDRLKQVLYNLIGNSLKYTEKGTITLGAEVDGHEMRFFIEDTGRGIPEENQQFLFHKFQQASDSILTRDTAKGTGLGLYISKLLLEGMSGSIRLDSSKEGKGSRFSFTLPLADSSKD